MQFSLIIPAYNKESTILQVLSAYNSFLRKLYSNNYEIIVVSDGADSTTSLVRSEIKKSENICLLEFQNRLGKGGALIEGFKEAKGALIGFVDADESISTAEFHKLISNLKSGQCAIASRWASGAVRLVDQPFSRKIASRLFNLFIRVLFSLPFSDTQCGAKIFTKSAIKKILPKLTTRGFEVDVELLWRLKKEGFKTVEVPIEWKHEEKSTFSLLHGPKMIVNLLLLKDWFNGAL